MLKQILSLILLVSVNSFARTYVVSPTGNDSNNGDADAPFKTISKAAQLMKAGDDCIVKGGDYYECIKPASSGTKDNPIEFKTAPGERVIIWGTEKLSGWTRDADGIWSASMSWNLGKNNQLFISGKPGYEARWPNRTTLDLLNPEGAKVDAGGDDFITCKEFPAEWSADAWRGGTIWCMADKAWTSWTLPLKEYDSKSKTIKFAEITHSSIKKSMNPGGKRESHFFLTGKRIGLDFPGEWLYDAKLKRMFLVTPEGKDPNTLHITAKRRMNAFEIKDKDYLVIEGFEIIGASISMRSCDHCMLKNLKASYVSHTRGEKTHYSLNEDTGLFISGNYIEQFRAFRPSPKTVIIAKHLRIIN